MNARRAAIRRNFATLMLVALPISSAVAFGVRATVAQGWASEHAWTAAEVLSAMLFDYVLSSPAFLVTGIVHQGVMLWCATRIGLCEGSAMRTGTAVLVFAPMMISAAADVGDFVATATGALTFALLVRTVPRTAGELQSPR